VAAVVDGKLTQGLLHIKRAGPPKVIRITPMILEFCPDLSQRVYPDRNLPITRRTSPEDKDESSKQHDDEHHASNQSMTILDEQKNLRSNFIR
jgi:hypothetical protein